ncbi:hypothetical protein LshimejAT787_1104810 [Lyophyllum shimeji]|uniref:F-box domain-containing protein n=1 Tax=Lyophyllum shimeji TaxID=47721 RepID=A0A9P3PWG7_LYOSH|nr:hypothetical protein LshimejAT787_1104810 [Lyophyllum shimeji]
MTAYAPERQVFMPVMTRCNIAVWSRLPIELTREIILCLASTDTNEARSLRLVSRHTNVWVLPLLFRTLTLTTQEQVTRFASTLLPKRKLHIPALKSNLHNFPRPLSSYTIESLALVVNTRLPSVENALANVAPAFSRLKNLAITGQDLSANAHWLRQHPIHPPNMMILHFGSPYLVNFRDPIFRCVTHLYTSTLDGHRGSFVADVSQLSHLAVHTRLDHHPEIMSLIVERFLYLLDNMLQLQLFVFVLDSDDGPEEKSNEWMAALTPCLDDKRFIVLPHFRDPRMEWEAMLKGQNSVWDRALAWRDIRQRGDPREILEYRNEVMDEFRSEKRRLLEKRHPVEWEIDLVQREGLYPHWLPESRTLLAALS